MASILVAMKTKSMFLAGFLTLGVANAPANFAIDWSTMDGGGGTSSGGQFSVSGTIAQPDAGYLAGGQFSLAGGFWSGITVVQTPGAPLLAIQPAGGTVRIYWAAPAGGFVLESSTNVLGTWSPVSAPYATNASEISVTIAASEPMQFFRLRRP